MNVNLQGDPRLARWISMGDRTVLGEAIRFLLRTVAVRDWAGMQRSSREGFTMTKKLALVAAMLLAVGGVAHADIDPIKTRQAGLGLLAGTAAGVKAVITANGDVKTLEGPARNISRWAHVFPTLFPAGSDKGETKAAPAIWSDNAGFQKAAAGLATAADSLAAAAKAGDATAVGVAFKAVGDACGACHKDYRLK